MVESPPNPSPGDAPDAAAKPRRRAFALITLTWAAALLLGHALPELLDLLFAGLRRPRHVEVVFLATLLLLAAATTCRTLGATTALSRPARALFAAALMLGFGSLLRTLELWPSTSPQRALIEASGLLLLWLGTLILSDLTTRWPRTVAWLARLALLGLIPLLTYLALVVPIPTFFSPLAAVIFSSSATDKTAHFWVALALTLLLAAAGQTRKHHTAWLFFAVMIMLLSAPLIELVQGATGRGRELSDALAHAVGTLTALALLLTPRLGAFTPPESPESPEAAEASAPTEHLQ